MSGSVKDLGRNSGFITIGEVVNHEDDPAQAGQVRVRWQTGAAQQHDVGDEDLPWTQPMYPSTNPSLDQTGGPHTGLRKGSRVVGIPLDGQGQDFLILGTILRGGDATVDQPATFDSHIPQPAKTQQNGGETQPRYGDVNGVATKESIVSYAESQGGGRSAKYAQVNDPIGTLDKEIV